jgi:outer membrane protein OmpA-like peptidoglycan-associated protein
MKINLGAASLLALALYFGQTHAEDNATTTEQPIVVQPAQPADAPPAPAVEVPAPAIPAEVLALLGDTRAVSELSGNELRERAGQARKFAKDESLPQDIRDQLKAIVEAARGEIVRRAEAKKAPDPAPEPAPAQAEQAPAPALIADDVQAVLNDTRPAADLSVDDLHARAKEARRMAADDSLPQDIRVQLKTIAKAARQEISAREQKPAEQAPAPDAPPAPAVVQEAPAPDAPPAPAVVQEAPPPVVPQQDAPPPAAEAAGQPPAPPAPAAADVKQLDSNAGNPEAELKAKSYLDDTTDLASLSDDDLRNRIDSVRDLMSGNELSRETERTVRKKLKAERDLLRQRLAAAEAKQLVQEAAKQPEPKPIPAAEIAAINAAPLPPVPVQPPVPPPPPAAAAGNATVNNTTITNITNTTVITNVTPVQVVLADRRPPEELQLAELQRRVRVYNDVQFDQDYDQEYRDYWRAAVARDREILRRRMLAERRQREVELSLQASDGNLDISINLNFSPSRPRPPQAVFAAEVDDAELEEILVAPPRQSIKQRYSLDEISVQPKLRNTVSRIEIDTIRFGSGQAFVREEQLDSLDSIAAIIERIVKKYPNEIFMIEGHTDAVGSDGSNIVLSKARADAVKKALTSYYVIPARNLRTVGLGERFLKIPTADAEPENRRVSIARVTQILSEE